MRASAVLQRPRHTTRSWSSSPADTCLLDCSGIADLLTILGVISTILNTARRAGLTGVGCRRQSDGHGPVAHRAARRSEGDRPMTGTVVVGLGGNALVEPEESGTYREQCAHARAMARSIAELAAAGWRVVIVHGNGPQVGALAVQQDAARDDVPPQPLFSLVAM